MKKLLLTIIMAVAITIAMANELEIINSTYQGINIDLYQNNDYMGTYFVPANTTIYINIGSALCYNYSYVESKDNISGSFYNCVARVY